MKSVRTCCSYTLVLLAFPHPRQDGRADLLNHSAGLAQAPPKSADSIVAMRGLKAPR